MAETPPPAPPTPPSEEDQKKKLHTWLDEWADEREKKQAPKRTHTDPTTGQTIFSSLFGA